MERYWRIFPYQNRKSRTTCLATSPDLQFYNFKSLQNYAKLFQHPTKSDVLSALDNLKKNPTIYEAIGFVYVLLCWLG